MNRRSLLGGALAGGLLAATGGAPAYAGTTGAGQLPGLDPDALDAAIDPLGDEVSGALVRVEGAAGRWHGRAGVAELGTARPVPWNGRFRIGSMTKTFTATAVLQLAAAGLVDVDAPLRRYLPDLLPEGYPGTVRQALDHTHGLRGAQIPSKDPEWFFQHRYDTFAPGSQVRWTDTPLFTPGERQQYSNAGYIVAGLVIERVTGRPYADAVRRGILRPLGLHATSLPGARFDIPGPHAHGYQRVTDGGRVRYVDVTRLNPTLQWAAAEMISTTGDLDDFLVALFGGRLLPRRQLDVMLTVPQAPTWAPGEKADGTDATYSAGLTRFRFGGLEVWGKSGDRPGYNNGMGATLDLRRRLTYSVNTLNMGGEQPAVANRIIMAALT
ncbi:serine hydrolase domain-containing protein [Actinoplanes teichomyceticus]|uniref:D-alanyl-D-alanine carboxypeptidase n=1 Tax=Actinoplanes teichomyceticus TaxID=1867 RepID=A0A561WJX8_ACTTI|nr:serine hydrolase domain-containing protein [Actinoplanes teichomyceticus]TWG24172.1 D-alanyl-D-alanine carboxypeptidase [Actinoplanes teichomyceticus]GIF12983.1 peptidase [Actinoplanes teichomyceticus]